MTMTHFQLRDEFKKFWQGRGHMEVPPIPLVPQNDPTTLFTGSGMQQLVPFLLGEPHPLGKKLYNIQPCFRGQDIEEIGDNRHDTFFEMMGNWSLGTYFKKEQLAWFWEFLTVVLGLPKEKLYITVFKGEDGIGEDGESIEIWKNLGIADSHIYRYGADKNWWSRSGTPKEMPAGEPGGPNSEVFFDFGQEHEFHKNSPFKDKECHPNCDCGRFVEIGNSVFMEYRKNSDGSLSPLPNKNVDFGGGMERTLMAVENKTDLFATGLFADIVKEIEVISNRRYDSMFKPAMRVVADHLKAAVFLIKSGVYPSNKEQGYFLRRLLRRSAVRFHSLGMDLSQLPPLRNIISSIIHTYGDIYFDSAKDLDAITPIIEEEIRKFSKALHKGIAELGKAGKIDGTIAFNLYQSYGLPLEIQEEILKSQGKSIADLKAFRSEFEKHKELSRTASAGKFKGGLADQSEQVVKYHTATHLLHQALYDALGLTIRQEGSNITGERLRFDFNSPQKPTDEQLKKIENMVNDKIKEALPVDFKIMPKTAAEKLGAKSFFREKYPDVVKVYFIGNSLDSAYSKEFCGGPHVRNTSDIGHISIFKTEKIGSNLYRIYAK